MSPIEPGLKIEIERQARRLKVKISGTMDESSDFAPLNFDGVDAADIELDGIRRINSAGILLWTRMARAIPKTVDVTLVRCSVVIFHQLQIFPLFLDSGRIKVSSFSVDYQCEQCEAESNVLLDSSSIGADGLLPQYACKACNGALTASLGMPRVAFLKRQGA